MRSRHARALRTALRSALLTATLFAVPAATQAQQGGVIIGDIPDSGAALLIVTQAMPPADLADALGELGCDAESIAVTINGRFVVYVPEAPVFVNAAFPESMDVNEPFVTRCREAG